MKRKRGKKKAKAAAKKASKPSAAAAAAVVIVSSPHDDEAAVANLISLSNSNNNNNTNANISNISDNSADIDDDGDGNGGKIDNDGDDEFQSQSPPAAATEVNTPSSTGTDQPLNLANINPDGSVEKGKSLGKVKVKLKSSGGSKMVDSQSDTDKSRSSQVEVLGLEKQSDGGGGGGGDKKSLEVVDSGNSKPELKMYVSRKPSGGIKIKSAAIKMFENSSVEKSVEKKSGDDEVAVLKEEDEGLGKKKELETMLSKEVRFDKEELNSSLVVIKKVMKMDAAEPFNVPVNPEALGIPDYFDVIDTPMDFGTICSNLERGDKYMNSKDVYEDVKLIWENCFKYNSKGDYILDLMRRVKKNLMKYWTAAGLYTEPSKGATGADGEDVTAASHVNVKSAQTKKAKKRHGRRHKLDCLCAICVLKRRRREREENARLAKGLVGVTQEFNQEESSPNGSLDGEDSTSNIAESVDPEADVEVEGKRQEEKVVVTENSPLEQRKEVEEEEEEGDEDNEMEIQMQGTGETAESQSAGRSGEEPNGQSQPAISENASTAVHMHPHNEDPIMLHEETLLVQQNKRKLQEMQERQEKVKVFKKFYVENPLLLSLCGTLFPDHQRSVWNGPHSLAQHQGSARTRSLRAAVESSMK